MPAVTAKGIASMKIADRLVWWAAVTVVAANVPAIAEHQQRLDLSGSAQVEPARVSSIAASPATLPNVNDSTISSHYIQLSHSLFRVVPARS